MVKEITALQAWDILNTIDNAYLVDTRTEHEWNNIGKPKVLGKVYFISSHLKPDMSANPDFVDELAKNITNKEAKLIFICRSNNRSKIAASIAESVGYTVVSFVSDGFEGSNYGPGWKNSDLPCE